MKIELLRTEEADGNWYKILGANGWPLKVIKFNESDEETQKLKALEAYDEIVEKASNLKIIVLKSIEI